MTDKKMRLSRMENLQILLGDLHSHLCKGYGDSDIICDDGQCVSLTSYILL